jgi:hypoxia up-regulated 1
MAMLPLLVLLLFATTASAAHAVMGIDLGTEYLKAAIAKPGSPIDVVLTKDSKRKEAATLAFKPSRAQSSDEDAFPERLYGGDAVALSARYPSDVFPNLKALLGLPRYSDQVKEYTARYPGLMVDSVSRFEDNARGTVGFRSKNYHGKETFMVEELLAMQLKNIKANAEAATGKGSIVTDAVFTIPPYYTAEEKRAVQLAAELAGIRVLGMISDGLAVGLNYATTRTFASVSDGVSPVYHLVYDMGAGSTTATVLRFQGRIIKDLSKRNKTIQEVQVIGTGFDRTLGGDTLNDVIVKDMINQFVESPSIKKLGLEPVHVRGDSKTMARLWKEAERVRQVLSANSMTVASLESLYYEDTKFKYSITREHFEKLAKPQAARVTTPMIQALETAGITIGDLESIILHGGAVRTPLVQKQLETVPGAAKKIKTNVNADEAAVMGATFKAAGLSASFRVKDIKAYEISGSAINLKWSTEGKDRQQKLFPASSQVGPEKEVSLKILEDVIFNFEQVANAAENLISEVEVTNLTKSVAVLKEKHGCSANNISTIFNIRLSPLDGLPEITSGSVSCVAESSKDGGVMDGVKGLFGFGAKKGGEEDPLDLDTEGEDSTLTPLPVSDPTSSGSTISETSSAASSASSKSKSKSAKVPKPTAIVIPLELKSRPLGLNAPPASSLPRIRQRLSQFDSSDRNTDLRAEALNTLEAFTYKARDYLEDKDFIGFSTDKARSELEKQLSATSEWLYGDGMDAKLQEFKDKLKALKTIVDPVLTRKQEGGKREEAVKSLKDALENVTGMIKMVEGSIERVAKDAAASASSAAASVVESVTSAVLPSSAAEGDDLEDDPYSKTASAAEVVEEPAVKPYEYTSEDLSSLTTTYETTKAWLEEKLAQQGKLGPYDDPAVLVSELQAKASQLQSTVSDVIMKTIQTQRIPKPKAAKKDKAKSKKSKSKSKSGGTNTTSSTVTSTTLASSSGKDEL